MTMPHIGVYCKLAPSPIHGVGVFALVDIPKDTDLFGPDTTNLILIAPSDVDKLPPSYKQLYQDFAVLHDGWWHCPPSFNHMTNAWYLNHSDTPNVVCIIDDYAFISLRDIVVGEELLVDYNTYSEQGI